MKATFKRGLLAAATAGMMMAGAGAASAFDLGGYTGPVEFKFAGVSTGQNTVGNENTWTIGNVTSITDGFSNLWGSGDNNEFMTFMLYGVRDISIIPDGSDFDIYSAGSTTGGGDGKIHIDVYLDTVPPGTAADLSGGPAARSGLSSYPTITDGTLFLSLELVPGIVGDVGGTAVDESTATLFQNANATTNPATGDGQFYAEVTGGSAAALFDTNGFLAGLADMFGQFDFRPATATGSPFFGCGTGPVVDTCWENTVNDPILANVTIPEPGTLGLVGAGLVALAGFSRRRRKAA